MRFILNVIFWGFSMGCFTTALAASTSPPIPSTSTALQKNMGTIDVLDLAHRRIIIDQKTFALADVISVSSRSNSPYGDGVLQNGHTIEYMVDSSGKNNHDMQGTLPVVTKIRLLSEVTLSR